MKSLKILTLALAATMLILSTSANAALHSRLGGAAAYDDVLDITWLTNASLSGTGTWDTQLAWADNLVILGFDDWRLPSADLNGDGILVTNGCANVELACRDNEMRYMFTHTMGGTWNVDDKTGNQTVDGVLLTGIQRFWTGTLAPWDNFYVLEFRFNGGHVGGDAKWSQHLGWAVRNGDVGEWSDEDGDGVPDELDNCPVVENPLQGNNDGDVLGDVCDPDDDNDGTVDTADNCPIVSNSDQADDDFDGMGNACDSTYDADSVSQHAEDVASEAVAIITSINVPGGNGMISNLTGNGGVTQKIANATTAYNDGLIDLATYLSELNTALNKLGAFDNKLNGKINSGKIVDPEATSLIEASEELRATIEGLIVAADG